MDDLWRVLMAPTDYAARNAQYSVPSATNYNTPLKQMDEFAFRQWVANNNVPFNPDAQKSDYDMRGFWQGLMQGSPHASTAINANDGQMHFTDYWKTPLHQSFSNESKYAGAIAPQWINDRQLAAPNGKILFDETSREGS